MINIRKMLIHALEGLGANPPTPADPPDKGESIIVENLSHDDMKSWVECMSISEEISTMAQRLYLLMTKADALRDMFWTDAKLKYESAYQADKSGKILGIRRLSNNEHVLVAFPPQKNDDDDSMQTPDELPPFPFDLPAADE